MSEFELVILLREYGGAISEQFNFWMATTFAVVIASYTAGDRLGVMVRYVLVILYLAAVGVFYLRYLGALDSAIIISQKLTALDSDFGPRAIPWASFLRRFVMIAGTILAVVIMVRPSLSGMNSEKSRDV